MSQDTEIVPEKSNQSSLMSDTINYAIKKDVSIEELERLLVVKERWEANEAKKSYYKAMSQFKANPPVITKDKFNKQYGSRYTSIENLVNTTNPELSKQDLSSRWNIEQNGIIKVTCFITHQQGYSESACVSGPADTSGSKNTIQQIKSTITYLKGITFESICGLASTEANLDDDGQAATDELISTEQLNKMSALIKEKGRTEESFAEHLKLESLADLRKKDYQTAISTIKNAVKK